MPTGDRVPGTGRRAGSAASRTPSRSGRRTRPPRNPSGAWSPDLHPAVDDDVDARDVRALVAGQEQREVRHVLRLTQTAQERPFDHLAREPACLPSSRWARFAPLSIRPGQIELTRMPSSVPPIAI